MGLCQKQTKLRLKIVLSNFDITFKNNKYCYSRNIFSTSKNHYFFFNLVNHKLLFRFLYDIYSNNVYLCIFSNYVTFQIRIMNINLVFSPFRESIISSETIHKISPQSSYQHWTHHSLSAYSTSEFPLLRSHRWYSSFRANNHGKAPSGALSRLFCLICCKCRCMSVFPLGKFRRNKSSTMYTARQCRQGSF